MAFTPADRLKNLAPSATLALAAKAKALKAAGRDVIELGLGEPDFNTPEWIRKAANDAMEAGKTKYTEPAGMPDAKKAVIEKFKRENGLEYKPEEVMVSVGAKQIIFNAMMASINPGDEVIIPAPYWVSYPEIVKLFGGVPIIVDCPEDKGFKVQPADLERAITPKTKWVILNSPSNPTGGAYSRDEMKALTDVFMRHDHVWIMADDIYEHLVYDGFQFVTPAQVEPGIKDRTLTINGVSKAYAMTGFRIGYCGGDAGLIKAMSNIQSQSTSSPVTPSQYATIAALGGDQSFLNGWRAEYKARRDFMVDRLNNIKGLSCRTPEGAFYVYPSCEGLIGATTPEGKKIANDEDYVTYLLETEGLGCVHGAAFGKSPYFRISYATGMDKLEEACKRIQRANNALKGPR